MIVYKLTHIETGKAYIGITVQSLRRRVLSHVRHARHDRNRAICRAINKYGIEGFRVEILQECSSVDEMKAAEIALIAEHRTLAPNGYNLTSGGDGVFNPPRTDEYRASRQRGADTRRRNGFKPCDAAIDALRKSAASRKGKPLAPEVRAKISAALRCKEKPDGFGKKMREVLLGRTRTPEQVDRIRGAAKNRRALSESDVRQILSRLAAGERQKGIAADYGISVPMVSTIAHGKTYRDLTTEHPVVPYHGAKVCRKTHEQIIAKRDAGICNRDIAKDYGLSHSYVRGLTNTVLYPPQTMRS